MLFILICGAVAAVSSESCTIPLAEFKAIAASNSIIAYSNPYTDLSGQAYTACQREIASKDVLRTPVQRICTNPFTSTIIFIIRE